MAAKKGTAKTHSSRSDQAPNTSNLRLASTFSSDGCRAIILYLAFAAVRAYSESILFEFPGVCMHVAPHQARRRLSLAQ